MIISSLFIFTLSQKIMTNEQVGDLLEILQSSSYIGQISVS